MIFELAAACFLLGSLLGFYAATLIAGRHWSRLMDEQTVGYETRILEVERKAAQLGTQVLANTCTCPNQHTFMASCPIHGVDGFAVTDPPVRLRAVKAKEGI